MSSRKFCFYFYSMLQVLIARRKSWIIAENDLLLIMNINIQNIDLDGLVLDGYQDHYII